MDQDPASVFGLISNHFISQHRLKINSSGFFETVSDILYYLLIQYCKPDEDDEFGTSPTPPSPDFEKCRSLLLYLIS